MALFCGLFDGSSHCTTDQNFGQRSLEKKHVRCAPELFNHNEDLVRHTQSLIAWSVSHLYMVL